MLSPNLDFLPDNKLGKALFRAFITDAVLINRIFQEIWLGWI